MIEGFADRLLEPDQELLGTLEVVGAQLGQLIERRRAEESGVAVERRHRATLEAAIDCVITMDHNGDVRRVQPRRRADLRLHERGGGGAGRWRR